MIKQSLKPAININFPTDESSIHPRVTNTHIVTEAEASEIQNQIKQALAELSPR